MTLEEKQKFWTVLFEEKELVTHLPSIASEKDGVRYQLANYGEVSVKAVAATAFGDNFMSDTFIVEAKSESLSSNGFLKVLPKNAMLRDATFNDGMYDREIGMYRDYFRILNQLRANLDISLDVPDIYYGHVDEKDGSTTALLLKDLRKDGYRMADKELGLDYDHISMVLTSLADYHALTIASINKWKATSSSGETFLEFPDKVKFLAGKPLFFHRSIDMVRIWLKSIEKLTQESNRKDLNDWLQGVSDRLPEILKQDTLESSGPLACIVHGDFWNNNVLYKYDDEGSGSPVISKLLDFQSSRVGNPFNDILYFFYTSTEPEFREKHIMSLLRHYFDRLSSRLQLLNIQVACTWEDFVLDYKKRSLSIMIMGGIVMTTVTNRSVIDSLQTMGKEMEKNSTEGGASQPKGEMGMSVQAEEAFKVFFSSYNLSDNEHLAHRILQLASEVKSLQDSIQA